MDGGRTLGKPLGMPGVGFNALWSFFFSPSGTKGKAPYLQLPLGNFWTEVLKARSSAREGKEAWRTFREPACL